MEEPTLETQTAALGEAMRSYRSFEIHASYSEKIYELLASKGYMVYDF